MALGGMVYLNDRDLADFGFSVESAQNVFGALEQETPALEVAGSVGRMITSPDARVGVRIITIHGFLEGTSASDFRSKLSRLITWCSQGTLELRTAHASDIAHAVRWKGSSLPIFGPQFLNLTAIGDLVFECVLPYAVERTALPYAVTVTGSSGRIAIPLGDGPAFVDGRVDGSATNPKWSIYNAYGQLMQETQFNGTLGASDFLGWDGTTKRISLSTSSIVTSGDSLLRPGDTLPQLLGNRADPESGLGALVELSSGTGILYVRRTYQL